MDHEERKSLIERYRQGHEAVLSALEGITEAELDARPPGGAWSPRMVAHHLADSEMTSALRVRRLVAEERPAIQGYDEELWSRELFYATRPIALSLEAMRIARQSTAEILERLKDEQWGRAGTHSEMGAYGVETWLRIYAAHAHDHAEQIRRARAGRA